MTFEENGRSTGVTLRHTGLPPGADYELTARGWTDGLDSLAEYLAEA